MLAKKPVEGNTICRSIVKQEIPSARHNGKHERCLGWEFLTEAAGATAASLSHAPLSGLKEFYEIREEVLALRL
jgi:hypothetical protein